MFMLSHTQPNTRHKCFRLSKRSCSKPCSQSLSRPRPCQSVHLIEGILHLVKVRPFVEVAGEQLGQQGFGNVSHAAQDEADEDLHDGGPGKLHILLPFLTIGKGHQEQQQCQAGSQEAGHRFLQDTTLQSPGCFLGR